MSNVARTGTEGLDRGVSWFVDVVARGRLIRASHMPIVAECIA